jgi:drug/metabolite transporter (DMT)-like permease
VTALLSLVGALIVGASDFGGGVAARRQSPFAVAAWIQAASLGLIVTTVWFIDAPDIRTVDLTAGVVAGLSGTFSFVSLYAAFARGKISLLAPVAASVGAVVPTLVGLARGESLSTINVAGIVVALVAITMVTQERSDKSDENATPPLAFVLALVAGLGFSVFFLALAETQRDAGVIALTIGGGITMPRDLRPVVLAAGIAEGISNVFAMWAYQRGPLAVAAVLGAFYPVSTVLLARLVLSEQLRRVQWIGVGLALAAIPLVAVP